MPAQLTIRAHPDLIDRVRDDARRLGRSMNEHVVLLLEAATDPAHAGNEHAEVRERLRRAGLLSEWPRRSGPPPDPEAVVRARAAAGRGTPLSQIIRELRDEQD